MYNLIWCPTLQDVWAGAKADPLDIGRGSDLHLPIIPRVMTRKPQHFPSNPIRVHAQHGTGPNKKPVSLRTSRLFFRIFRVTFVMIRITLKRTLTGIRAIYRHPSQPIITRKSAPPVKRVVCSQAVSLYCYPASNGAGFPLCSSPMALDTPLVLKDSVVTRYP